MSFKDALFFAALADYRNRQHNREDQIRRLQDNVDRWEESLSKMRNALHRTEENIRKNEERLYKANSFLQRLSSPQTLEWLERQQKNALSNRSEVREAALTKIRDHEKKEQDVNDQIYKMKSWISESEDKIRDIKRKISDTESKISDVESKIYRMR
ncbi:hypothetical protein PSCT_03071 [Pseudomonas sp. SCT]|uniref:hypothetical protein n=1 Tax=Pseudomonas sp. (strain SCT) TaxID=412955 RepID=UPI000EDF6FED|nr:hypothetical protein [Pseudomonas sp. SCT]GCA56862.1 hypothetical protein PSCT_03071 [Pseudomonas sp. SCT]